jgi:hypothetical protein
MDSCHTYHLHTYARPQYTHIVHLGIPFWVAHLSLSSFKLFSNPSPARLMQALNMGRNLLHMPAAENKARDLPPNLHTTTRIQLYSLKGGSLHRDTFPGTHMMYDDAFPGCLRCWLVLSLFSSYFPIFILGALIHVSARCCDHPQIVYL